MTGIAHSHSPDPHALLTEAPVGRHFCQLHQRASDLAEAVGQFIATGLNRGNGCVMVACAEHTDLIIEWLRHYQIDVEAHRRSGCLTVLDADEVLARFMKGTEPNWSEFRRVVGPILAAADSCGAGGTRVYGKVVNILWHKGQYQAAIRLEEFWNELARLHPFSLFCAYMVDSQRMLSYANPLQEIGRTHSDIISTTDDERFRLAMDHASQEVFGVHLSQMLSLSGREDHSGEHRLPLGQRTMLWILRNVPGQSAEVLERARQVYPAIQLERRNRLSNP